MVMEASATVSARLDSEGVLRSRVRLGQTAATTISRDGKIGSAPTPVDLGERYRVAR